MLHLIAKDFRCFKELDVPVAPLTLLVGENSTGKSTFLALFRLAWDVAYGSDVVDFNLEPFLLGSYDDIARYHGGRGKRSREFEIGLDIKINGTGSRKNAKEDVVEFRGIFEKEQGHPAIKARTMRCGDFGIEVRGDTGNKGWSVVLSSSTLQKTISLPISTRATRTMMVPPFDFILSLARLLLIKGAQKEGKTAQSTEKLRYAIECIHKTQLQALLSEPWALAPIRTEPRRHYDPIQDTPDSYGGHVPMLLAKISRENEVGWSVMKKQIEVFGAKSEMFTGLRVVQGKKENEPFRIEVEVRGQKGPRNLVDVGYGVSQVLPILVDSFSMEKCWLLMQQPEVHLHPMAQAALGTLFADLVKTAKRRFIIETHSDYLVDRVTMAVRDGLPPDQVVILYFEQHGTSIQVHAVHLDKQGSLLDPPPGFKKFFIEEQRRFLGL